MLNLSKEYRNQLVIVPVDVDLSIEVLSSAARGLITRDTMDGIRDVYYKQKYFGSQDTSVEEITEFLKEKGLDFELAAGVKQSSSDVMKRISDETRWAYYLNAQLIDMMESYMILSFANALAQSKDPRLNILCRNLGMTPELLQYHNNALGLLAMSDEVIKIIHDICDPIVLSDGSIVCMLPVSMTNNKNKRSLSSFLSTRYMVPKYNNYFREIFSGHLSYSSRNVLDASMLFTAFGVSSVTKKTIDGQDLDKIASSTLAEAENAIKKAKKTSKSTQSALEEVMTAISHMNIPHSREVGQYIATQLSNGYEPDPEAIKRIIVGTKSTVSTISEFKYPVDYQYLIDLGLPWGDILTAQLVDGDKVYCLSGDDITRVVTYGSEDLSMHEMLHDIVANATRLADAIIPSHVSPNYIEIDARLGLFGVPSFTVMREQLRDAWMNTCRTSSSATTRTNGKGRPFDTKKNKHSYKPEAIAELPKEAEATI